MPFTLVRNKRAFPPTNELIQFILYVAGFVAAAAVIVMVVS